MAINKLAAVGIAAAVILASVVIVLIVISNNQNTPDEPEKWTGDGFIEVWYYEETDRFAFIDLGDGNFNMVSAPYISTYTGIGGVWTLNLGKTGGGCEFYYYFGDYYCHYLLIIEADGNWTVVPDIDNPHDIP